MTSKKVGSLRMQPLKGKFFDIKPASNGQKAPVFASVRDYGRFALIAFLAFLVLNFGNAYIKGKNVIFESSNLAYAGYEELQQGMDQLLKQDGPKATEAFLESQKIFLALQKTTAPFTSQSGNLEGQNEYLETADSLVNMALDVSEMGQKLAGFSTSFKTLPDEILSFKDEEGGLIKVIHQKKDELRQILQLATNLQQKLAHLNIEVLPEALQQKITTARKQIGQFLAVLMELDTLTNQLLILMGDQVPHRYLILFQNNHEIRATGGFIGSYMIMDVNDGKITKMETKDIYSSDGQLSKKLPAPPGIDKVAKQWFMRDANYSPDFPTSARQIMWFLEASRGPSVDTVVAIDQSLVEGILGLLGEIKLEGFPQALKADNFSQVISFYTEAKLSQTNTPKQLLFDLIPRFKEKLVSFDNLTQVLTTSQKMTQEGHIQVYSRNPDLQTLFKNYGLSGEVIAPHEKTDYLNVVSTSIGGNKTDEFIETNIDHTTLVDARGGLENELTIEKRHTFKDEDLTSIQALIEEYGPGQMLEGDLIDILGRGKNLDYMRVYVPLGSEIMEVAGIKKENIKVSEDLGYTVFGFTYGPISPGEEKEITIQYRLPFELNISPIDNYRFVAQKQAGVDGENITLHKTLKMTSALQVKKAYPEPPEGMKVPVLSGEFDGTKLYMTAISDE